MVFLVNKNHFSLIVMSLMSALSSLEFWDKLCLACRTLIDRISSDDDVWQQIAETELVETYGDAESVLSMSRVEDSWSRFAVFIKWLQRHVLAFEFWCDLVKDHFDLCVRCILQLIVTFSDGNPFE